MHAHLYIGVGIDLSMRFNMEITKTSQQTLADNEINR